MDSQLAYDLASKGLVRPWNSKVPIIYGLKCVEFKSPEFTIGNFKIYTKNLIVSDSKLSSKS